MHVIGVQNHCSCRVTVRTASRHNRAAAQCISRHCTGHFTCCQQNRASGCGLIRRNERKSLRSYVSCNLTGEISCIDIVYIGRCRRIRHIINHHAADALQSDESKRAVSYLLHCHSLRLNAFLRAAAVDLDIIIGTVEPCRQIRRCSALKAVCAVIDKFHCICVIDRERTASKKIVLSLFQTCCKGRIKHSHIFRHNTVHIRNILFCFI